MTPAIAIDKGAAGSGPVSSKWFGPGLTDRVLKLFTTVEAGEGIGAVLVMLFFFPIFRSSTC